MAIKFFFKKKSLLTVSKVLVSVAILWLLINQAQIKFELFIRIFHHPFLSICAILMFLLMVVVSAWRWHILNSTQEIHLGFLNTIMPTYLGAAFNNLLPGAIGGDVIRLYYLFKKVPGKKSTALLSIFFDRFFGFMGILLLIGLIALLHIQYFNHQRELLYLLLACAIFCIALITIFSCLMIAPQYIKLDVWLNQLSHKRWIKPIISFFNAVRVFRITKQTMLKCLIASIFVQILIVMTILIISKILGIPLLSFSDYAMAMGISQIISLIPVTPGGIGIGEMVFANILMLLNPGTTMAYATIFLVFRLISFIAYLPGIISSVPRMMFMKQKNPSEEIAL